jgi:hypothetical protein
MTVMATPAFLGFNGFQEAVFLQKRTKKLCPRSVKLTPAPSANEQNFLLLFSKRSAFLTASSKPTISP